MRFRRFSPKQRQVLAWWCAPETRDREAIIWHDIQNSHRTRRILTGTLDGVEKTESGLILAVVNYKGFRVAIPIREMLLYTGKIPSGREYIELMDRLQRILNTRLGAEIDFIVKGEDPYLIEINSIPGMSAHSIIPQQARQIGMSVSELYDIIIEDTYQSAK